GGKLRASDDASVRRLAVELALKFNDTTALDELRRQAADPTLSAPLREQALAGLLAKKDAGLASQLLALTDDPAVRRAAIRGLAQFDLPEAAAKLLSRYAEFDAPTRADVLQTVAARSSGARLLLAKIADGEIPAADLSAFTARQIASLGDKQLTAQLKAVWGEVRSSAADKTRLIEQYKRRFTPAALARADRAAGRAVFEKTCANCHRLFGSGGAIGPDLTGSQRANLDYLLQNVIDPSASVAKDFQMQTFATDSGRVITGLVVEETESAIVVQTQTEKLVVPRDEVEARSESNLSLMPEGLLQPLSAGETMDLIAYLVGSTQAPLTTQP
ncbi:MAG: c-type cytochrome, partial [Planctomycetales bacterium]|nr:c-type cytochrome [Planctomycetales bacterium]